MTTNDPRPDSDVAPTPLDHEPAPSPVGPSRLARWSAEALGTFLLVFGGVGSALLAAT